MSNIQAQIDQHWAAVQPFLPARTIVFTGFINENSANELMGHVLFLERLSPDAVTLVIQSEGGQVYAGLALYDVLQNSRLPLITVADTLVAGNALLLLLAGQKRYTLPNTALIYTPIHAPAMGLDSDIYILGRETQRLQAIHDRIWQPYLPAPKKPANLWQKWFGKPEPIWKLNEQYTFSLQEALDFKLIDAVVDRVEDARL